MNKLLAALLLTVTASAFAGESTSVTGTFDVKDKQNSPANHEVFG